MVTPPGPWTIICSGLFVILTEAHKISTNSFYTYFSKCMYLYHEYKRNSKDAAAEWLETFYLTTDPHWQPTY